MGYAQKLVLDIEAAYWDLYLVRKETVIRRQSLELARQLLADTEELIKAGRRAPLDLVEVKAAVATREKALIDTRTAHLQKCYRLHYLMHDTLSWESYLMPMDSVTSLTSPDSLALHVATAQRFRPDLRQSRLLLAKGELDVAVSRNGLLPKLDFFIQLQTTGYARSFTGAILPEDNGAQAFSVGLTGDIAATQGRARARHSRVRSTRESMVHSVENLENLVEYEVRSAYRETERSQQQIAAAAVVRELQAEKLVAEEQKLAAGKSTGYQVLQAQRDLTEALLDEVRTRISYTNALAALYLKDGTLLERRGIRSMP